MKKVVFLALVLALCIGMCACEDTLKTTEESKNQSTESTKDQSSETSDQLSISSINDLCSFLESNSLVAGAKTKMDATMIGAVEGYKYSNSKVEIYTFESDAPASVELSGFGMTITFDVTKGNYAIICAEATNRNAIISAVSALEIK